MAAQQRSNKRSSRGMSPGRSMAQFGHAGHAGKSQSKAQKHQKAGINTPSRGPGSNPNMGQTPPKKTATVSTPKKTTLKKGITATKAAGKTAKELAYLNSLGRLFAGDPTPALKMIGGQYAWDKSAPIRKGLGSAIKNLFGFSHAGAADLDIEELLKKERERKGISTTDTTDVVEAIPDLTDPQVMSNIAVTTGLPTETKKFKLGDDWLKTKIDYPTPDAASTIKSIQSYKRDPELNLTAPNIIDYFGTDGQYKGMDLPQVQSIYDMVQLPNQRTLVANGGLINLFKYGGFLG